jgi:hypothetical protein
LVGHLRQGFYQTQKITHVVNQNIELAMALFDLSHHPL